MRKIVFSFDDCLLDFVENALPLFDKYFFKATLNVITSFSEKKEVDGFKYIDIATLKSLNDNGFELACHSDTHSERISATDFESSLGKMKKYFGDQSFGAILPYSQRIGDDCFGFLKSNFSYLADYPFERRKNNLYYHLSYFFGRLFKNKKMLFYYCNYSYFYPKNKGFYTFKRLPIKKNQDASLYIHFLKHMPDKTNLTIMLHSIVNDRDKCPWGEGSWSVYELDKLLAYLQRHKKRFCVLTQKEIANE